MEKKLYATLVIKNGNVWTMDDNNPRVQCIAVFSDYIIKLGNDDEIVDLIGPQTIILDAKGKTVLPGFIDSHTHIAWTGLNKVYLDMRNTKSLDEAVDLVKEEIEKLGEGEWVIGRAWDQSNWPEKRYLTAADLDPISPKNPVFLRHVSGHFMTVNTLAFKKLGLTKDIKGVDLDEGGNVIGTLRDIELDDKEEIRPKFDDFIIGLKLGMEEAVSLGITSIHDNITFENLFPYLKLKQKNELMVRVYGIIYQDMIDEAVKLGLTKNHQDKWFRIGACKLMTDGAISSRTAYVYEQYEDKEGEFGFPLYDDKKLDEMVKKVHDANLQIAAHVIGDKAASQLFDAIARNLNSNQSIKAKHRVEHGELLRKEDVIRSTKHGLIYSMQPNFVWRWGMVGQNGMYERRLGTARTMINNPFTWIVDNNLLLIFGSDGMPLGPLYGLKGAIFHPNPDLQLPLEEAIRCYTLNPAKAVNEDSFKGSITEGKLADIVILSHNLDLIDIEEFHDVEVLYTIIGGEIKFKKEMN